MGTNEKQTPPESGGTVLPSLRLVFDKQVDALRAYGKLARPTKNRELAKALRYDESTLSDANGFFVSSGLIARGDGGYMAAPALVDYARACEWNTDTAGSKLAPLFETTWFYSALALRLEVRDMTEEEAIATLAEAAAVGPKERRRLVMLIDYLELASLVRRVEGGKISAATPGGVEIPVPPQGSRGPSQKQEQPISVPWSAISPGSSKSPDRQRLATLLLENAIDTDTPDDVLDAIWKTIRYLKGVKPRSGAEKGGVHGEQASGSGG